MPERLLRALKGKGLALGPSRRPGILLPRQAPRHAPAKLFRFVHWLGEETGPALTLGATAGPGPITGRNDWFQGHRQKSACHATTA
jgi:hypothetical protein